MVDVRQSLIDEGWRQGALLQKVPHEQFLAHSHIKIRENDLLLVISQTCDLVNPDFDLEPYCEVLRLTPQEKEPSAHASGGKNSRLLELALEVDGKQRFFQVVPFDRFYVDRHLLLQCRPDAYMDEASIEMVTAWLTKRLVRVAFPDSFDRRWKGRRKQIEKIIKRLERVRDVYLKIEPFSELDNDQEYVLEIVLLMGAGDFDNPETYEEYARHKADLEQQFVHCEGIDLEAIDLASDAAMTVAELQVLRRWDYSYLSYRDPEPHSPPVGV